MVQSFRQDRNEITQTRLLIFSLFAILLTHNVDGVSQSRPVSGQVIDAETEKPIADVQVTLVAAGWTLLSQTDEAGQFRFDEIAPGTCALKFTCVGYEMLNQEIAVNADPIAIVAKLKRSLFQLGEIVVTPSDEELASVRENNRP
jgi:hypothetical protein